MTQKRPTAHEVPQSDDSVEVKRYEFGIPARHEGRRLDAYLAGRFADYSRTFIKSLIEAEAIIVNGRSVKPAYTTCAGDRVLALVPQQRTTEVPPEDIPLDIIHEDRWIVVINKPPDIVVHPSRGHQSGTLVNALVHHFQTLSDVGGPLRPGIVHRLDRDTSGVILIVKDRSVHEQIARQFEERTTQKEYIAICEGVLDLDSDLIDAPIGRHPRREEKMAVEGRNQKSATTVYEVLERYERFTLVRCLPRSGRTHQIRVHLAHLRHPIVCDTHYGRRDRLYVSDLTGGEHPPHQEPLLARQALHAHRLTIHHPGVVEKMTFEAPLPQDMQRTVEALRERG